MEADAQKRPPEGCVFVACSGCRKPIAVLEVSEADKKYWRRNNRGERVRPDVWCKACVAKQREDARAERQHRDDVLRANEGFPAIRYSVAGGLLTEREMDLAAFGGGRADVKGHIWNAMEVRAGRIEAIRAHAMSPLQKVISLALVKTKTDSGWWQTHERDWLDEEEISRKSLPLPEFLRMLKDAIADFPAFLTEALKGTEYESQTAAVIAHVIAKEKAQKEAEEEARKRARREYWKKINAVPLTLTCDACADKFTIKNRSLDVGRKKHDLPPLPSENEEVGVEFLRLNFLC